MRGISVSKPKYLLDTNVVIWWLLHHPRISDELINTIQTNEVCVSMISLWEITIKKQIKKLSLSKDLLQAINGSHFRLVNLNVQDFDNLGTLPFHHRDPFDRIIIAQAITEGLTIITSDRIFKQYPVDILKI